MLKKFISAITGLSVLLCTVSVPFNTSSAVSFDVSDSMIEEEQSRQVAENFPPALDDIPTNECIQNLSGRVIKVMIDPGHYAYYNQSPVYSPYWESVMTWKLSNFLQEELQALGVHADLTKNSLEEDLALGDRGFKSKGYDFFISIHSNASSYSSADYPLAIIYQDLDWTTIDDTSREIGEILAATVTDVMQTNQKGQTYQKRGQMDMDRNGVYDDEWYSVLYGSRYVGTPGILLEHSFHTNYRATLWLYDENNLRKMAKEEAKAIFDYFSKQKALEYPPIPVGDVNDNGIIDASDASMILSEYSLLSTGETSVLTSDELKPIADVNGDGLIDASDASDILAFYSFTSTGGTATDITAWKNSQGL